MNKGEPSSQKFYLAYFLTPPNTELQNSYKTTISRGWKDCHFLKKNIVAFLHEVEALKISFFLLMDGPCCILQWWLGNIYFNGLGIIIIFMHQQRFRNQPFKFYCQFYCQLIPDFRHSRVCWNFTEKCKDIASFKMLAMLT